VHLAQFVHSVQKEHSIQNKVFANMKTKEKKPPRIEVKRELYKLVKSKASLVDKTVPEYIENLIIKDLNIEE